MNLTWFALLFLTCLWPAVVPIYQPAGAFWPLLPVIALFLVWWSYWAQFGARLAAWQNAVIYCGFTLFTQGVVFAIYYLVAPRAHRETVFAPLAAALLKLFGVQTAAQGGVIYLDSFLKTVVLYSNWETVGLPYLLLFLAGGVAALLICRGRGRDYGLLAGLTFLYVLLRYVALLLLFTGYGVHSVFWERTITWLSFVPYVILLHLLFRRLSPADLRGVWGLPNKKTAAVTAWLAFALFFSAVAFWGFHDPGRQKQGRVLVDEYHSNWEWTTDTYDEHWFGERSGYNYYCFFALLDKYYQTRRNTGLISADALKNEDVLIIKTPTTPFTPEEVKAMTDFVRHGGGLYLIGDHTNVFGMGTNLNQIAPVFGLRFNYDCTYDLTTGNLSEYSPPKILPHPAVAHLPRFLFATSDTLQAGWQAEEIITGYGLKTYQADYSQKNFFPADTNSGQLEFGLFLQGAGVQYGKGRVLALADSTPYSNFWMFMPGKPELLLGNMEWLNRENRWTVFTPRAFWAVAALVALLANLYFWYRKRREIAPGVIVLAGLTAFVVGAAGFGAANDLTGKLPVSIKPITSVCFAQQDSRFRLPADIDGFLAPADQQLNTFYVWTQRLGYFPSVKPALAEALQGSLAVWAKPDKQLADQEQVLAQVRNGGKLLILDNTASGAWSNSLLSKAGMQITDGPQAPAGLNEAAGQFAAYGELQKIPLTANASYVTGGEALATDENGNAILACQRVGKGLIAVCSDPDLFYNAQLGDVSANLTDQTEILTNLEFKLLKYLVEDE
ncbi:MAG: GldG family protein [Firmicutes bacterium]|nr:GldG family protein [Bacillota bacterium]